MKIEQALILLKKNGLSFTEEEAEQFCEAHDMAINALELIDHIKDRPCNACEFHTDGCSRWTCVFDEYLNKHVFTHGKEQNDNT